jgi:hypothetical protein
MELGALLLALLNLVLAVLDGRRASKPEREARAARTEAIDDVDRLNQALRDKDADGVATFFERERLEAWGRLPARGDERNGDGLRASGGDDSGQPPASGQS